MDTAFWNIIHDGSIDSISGCVPGDVTLSVGVEWLCEELPTTAKTIEASLHGCTLLTFTPYGKSTISEPRMIGAGDIEVLSAVTRDDRINVCCVNGTLELAYRAIVVRLAEGTEISQSELEAAANRSVAKWIERNAHK